MPQNQSALITATLNELNRIGAGQTALSEDVAAITPRVGPILADLASKRVTVSAVDPTTIPDAIFPDLVVVFAIRCARLFGKELAPDAYKVALDEAENRLALTVRLSQTADPVVLQIIEQLIANGASWRTFDASSITNRIPGTIAELARRDVAYLGYDQSDLPPEAIPDFTRYVAASLSTPQLYAVMTMAEDRLRSMRPALPINRTVRAAYF